jgi:hypothetical protein
VKLDKYYNLTDRLIAYVAAVVLNLAYKWKYFEKHWALKPEWLIVNVTDKIALYPIGSLPYGTANSISSSQLFFLL